jgi:hypothetical protein
MSAFVVYLSAVVGVVGLVAAELWRLKRWNPWLIVIVCVVDILSAAPRLTEAPNALLRILATGGVAGGALIFLLVVCLTCGGRTPNTSLLLSDFDREPGVGEGRRIFLPRTRMKKENINMSDAAPGDAG